MHQYLGTVRDIAPVWLGGLSKVGKFDMRKDVLMVSAGTRAREGLSVACGNGCVGRGNDLNFVGYETFHTNTNENVLFVMDRRLFASI